MKRRDQAATTADEVQSGGGKRPPDPTPEAPTPPDSTVKVLVEPAAGEFGPAFAIVVGIVVLGVSTAIAMFFARVIMEAIDKLPEASQTVAKDAVTTPTYGEITGFIAMLVLVGIATILVLIGAYLAALETRGRLRRTWAPASIAVLAGQERGAVRTEAVSSDVEKVITAAGGLVEKLGVLRGTALVMASAVLLYILAGVVLLLS